MSWYSFYSICLLLILDWKLGESREHLSARVLYTTNEEDRSQTENPIRQFTNGFQQGNQINSDMDGEGESTENVLDAVDENAKSVESQQKSDETSNDMVLNCLFFHQLLLNVFCLKLRAYEQRVLHSYAVE